jgi:hypothetical protein
MCATMHLIWTHLFIAQVANCYYTFRTSTRFYRDRRFAFAIFMRDALS